MRRSGRSRGGTPGEKGQIRKDEKASAEGKSSPRLELGNAKERRVLVEVGCDSAVVRGWCGVEGSRAAMLHERADVSPRSNGRRYGRVERLMNGPRFLSALRGFATGNLT